MERTNHDGDPCLTQQGWGRPMGNDYQSYSSGAKVTAANQEKCGTGSAESRRPPYPSIAYWQCFPLACFGREAIVKQRPRRGREGPLCKVSAARDVVHPYIQDGANVARIYGHVMVLAECAGFLYVKKQERRASCQVVADVGRQSAFRDEKDAAIEEKYHEVGEAMQCS